MNWGCVVFEMPRIEINMITLSHKYRLMNQLTEMRCVLVVRSYQESG